MRSRVVTVVLLVLIGLLFWLMARGDDPEPTTPTVPNDELVVDADDGAAELPVRDRVRRTNDGAADQPDAASEAGDATKQMTHFRVLGPDGEPFEGAHITVFDMRHRLEWSDNVTDKDGLFSRTGTVGEEPLQFHVDPMERRDDVLSHTGDVVLGELNEVVLERALHVRGVVVDENGAPLAGVPVAREGEEWDLVFSDSPRRSDALGRFDLGGLEPGEQTWVAPSAYRQPTTPRGSGPPWEPPEQDRVKVTAGDEGVRLVLRSETTLRVRLTGGSPATAYSVHATHVEEWWQVWDYATDGSVLLTGLDPGKTYAVLVYEEEEGLVAGAADVPSGGSVDLVLGPGEVLRGTAVNHHGERERASGVFRVLGTNFHFDLNEDGSFVLPLMPPIEGQVEVTMWGDDLPRLTGRANATPGVHVSVQMTPE